jgi:hypothetical protein
MEMQKPSIGFDALLRLSSSKGDWGALAAQFRLAWNSEPGHGKLEPQIYNLYMKVKTRWGDFWLGHNRPAFGLSSFLDTHGQLVQTLVMEGFGFDRDWGAGYSRDLSWGSLGVSLTSGSGMDLHLKGNHLLSARLAWGVLERDNIALGASLSTGRVLPMTHPDAGEENAGLPWSMAALDLSHRFNQFDNRLELMLGRIHHVPARAFYWRGGMVLDAGERWKLESQASWWRRMGVAGSRLGLGFSWQTRPDLALRALAQYDGSSRSMGLVFQAYYYRQVWL